MAVMSALIATSCSQDEPMASLNGANDQINFSVTAGNSSRAASAYQNGIDISEMSVSAWLLGGNNHIPNYSESNPDNSSYFLNDFLVRSGSSGLFDYLTDARYWPSNNERLDFYAMVDNQSWGNEGLFKFDNGTGAPGLGWISQLGIDKMPDMLYAYTPNQTRHADNAAQQNVSFDFHHAFAKVIVTAEVKNSNMRVYITDMEICGIADKGQLTLPHKEDSNSAVKEVGASWNVGTGFMNVACAQGLYNAANPILLDRSESSSATLVGRTGVKGVNNDLLVIPNKYSGRNSSGKYQTYVKLKGYAYNIANAENGFNPETDALIFPKKNADGSVTPAEMIIPIEFDWKIGTVNRYNIVFDCGNGGSTTTDPNTPAFVRIGYEVEVTDWQTGEVITPIEYNKK